MDALPVPPTDITPETTTSLVYATAQQYFYKVPAIVRDHGQREHAAAMAASIYNAAIDNNATLVEAAEDVRVFFESLQEEIAAQAGMGS